MNILSIDPGYAKKGFGCACAAFRDDVLAMAWFERPEQWYLGAVCKGLDRVIWELPQMDRRTYAVPPEVLVRLTAAGATLAGLYAGATGAVIVERTPSQSKGSVPKPIAHARLWEVLSPAERLILGGGKTKAQIDAAVERGARDRWKKPGAAYYPSSWLTHNLLDAAALGCQELGRL